MILTSAISCGLIIMGNLLHLFAFLPALLVSASTEPADIVIVILSQRDVHSAAQAVSLRENITEQARELQREAPNFLLTHERIHKKKIKGAWTIYPLIPILHWEFANAHWHLFCLENTGINLGRLTRVLSRFNSSEALWIGHALRDISPTIIHHFADPRTRPPYPNIASGFVASKALIETLQARLNSEIPADNDFTIDASYEFSNFVYNNGKGPKLIPLLEFCGIFTEGCATYPKKFSSCGDPLSIGNIFFAVKTCKKNHSDRMPVLKKTWLRHALHHALFSNEEDEQLENIIVVPNTTAGHCGKTYSLLRHAEKIMKKKRIEWLVVTDDDTLLSVSRISNILSCYDPKGPVAVGERYGFRTVEETGYDYLTGGAGVALSAPLITKIVTASSCKCPMMTTPDDMFLFGICIRRLGLGLSHSSLFHQARPQDYSADYLATQEPVSFHKFWLNDPVKVYQDWFKEADDQITSQQHMEL